MYLKDNLIDTKILNFKLNQGYLSLKRRMTADMIFGPLFWGVSDTKTYLGLTKDNNLTTLISAGGIGFILCIPVFSSGGQYDVEYERIE